MFLFLFWYSTRLKAQTLSVFRAKDICSAVCMFSSIISFGLSTGAKKLNSIVILSSLCKCFEILFLYGSIMVA